MKKIYVYEEKREEKQAKKSVFPFSLFYGTEKIPSALGESCGNRNIFFQPYRTILLCLPLR
jgi:hypothetical protein